MSKSETDETGGGGNRDQYNRERQKQMNGSDREREIAFVSLKSTVFFYLRRRRRAFFYLFFLSENTSNTFKILYFG